MTKNDVANAGVDYACRRLSALGWNAKPWTGRTRGIDAVSDDGKTVSIRVKSLSKLAAVPLGTNLEKHIWGNFWVIVNSLSTDHPRTFVLLASEVRELAHRDKGKKRAYWLEIKDYAVDAFEEQWERIGQPLT